MQAVSDYRRLPGLVALLLVVYFGLAMFLNGCAPVPSASPAGVVNPYPGILHTQNGQEVAPPSWTNAPAGRTNGNAPRIAQEQGAM